MNPTAPAVPFSLADHQTRFRALISDLDGTLIDSEPLHMAAWNAICEKYHLPPFDYEYILSIGGMNTAEISRRRCEGRSDLDYEAVAREKIELYRSSYMQRVPLFPAIAALIDRKSVV